MKTAIMAGALAALMYGTTAGAQEPQSQAEEQPGCERQQGVGGAGQDPLLDPRVADVLRASGIFASLSPREEMVPSAEMVPPPEVEALGGSGLGPEPREPADMRGVTMLVGGGIEGYTGRLAPEVNPGATMAVTVDLRPSRVFGFELGYSGALNELDSRFVGNVEDGADVVRNGGQAALVLGLAATPLQPYVLGGVGLSYYNVRNGEFAGFQDDTVGTVPVGLGLRSHIGHFTADLRAGYNFLFGQQFAPAGGDDTGGSYVGTANLGGTF